MSIEKDFVPYQESLELKELGFDEPCFGNWQDMKEETPWFSKSYADNQNQYYGQLCSAPTFSQAFKFFREKYGLYHHIVPEFYTKGINFNWQILWYLPEEEWTNHVISDGTGLYGDNGEYPTQEEAELACLKKLIKIVKEKEHVNTN